MAEIDETDPQRAPAPGTLTSEQARLVDEFATGLLKVLARAEGRPDAGLPIDNSYAKGGMSVFVKVVEFAAPREAAGRAMFVTWARVFDDAEFERIS